MYGLYISINKKILKGTLEGDKEHFRGPKITLKIKFFKKNYIPFINTKNTKTFAKKLLEKVEIITRTSSESHPSD